MVEPLWVLIHGGEVDYHAGISGGEDDFPFLVRMITGGTNTTGHKICMLEIR